MLQASGRTMKLCLRAIATITINIHELQVCKQQHIASGTKSCKFIIKHSIKLGTLLHHITLMTKRRLQVCKQHKLVNLHFYNLQ